MRTENATTSLTPIEVELLLADVDAESRASDSVGVPQVVAAAQPL